MQSDYFSSEMNIFLYRPITHPKRAILCGTLCLHTRTLLEDFIPREVEELIVEMTLSPQRTDISYLFTQCGCIRKIIFKDSFDTSKVKNMYGLFLNCVSLEEIVFGSGFDTSLVEDMRDMFFNCIRLKSITHRPLTVPNVLRFNTSNVESMSRMFYNVPKELIDSLDISFFDMNNVRKHEMMHSRKEVVGLPLECTLVEWCPLAENDEELY